MSESNTKLVANLKKWAAALRSGKYRQARECMVDEKHGAYCCLGVAYRTLTGDEPQDDASMYSGPCYNRVQHLCGLKYHDITEFVKLNDTVELSFDEIADRVDELIAKAEGR